MIILYSFLSVRVMRPKSPGWRKLPEFVSHHIFGNVNGYKVFTIMHLEGQADKFRSYGRSS